MNSWLKLLRDALNLADYGVVFLDDSLSARFMNHAFIKMWSLPKMEPGRILSFRDLERHADTHGIARLGVGDLPAIYVRQRMKLVRNYSQPALHFRLPDGRVIRMESSSPPTGGRMLTYTDETALIQSIEKQQELVTTDELTQVDNRRFFYSTGQTEVDRARRYRHPLSVVLVQPDNLAGIKQVYGHEIADQVLVFIARCCRQGVRELDHVGRLRGSEFAITLIEAPFNAALRVAEKLSRKIAATPVQTSRGELLVTASFGVASLTENVSEFGQLLKKADRMFGPEGGARQSDGGTGEYGGSVYTPAPVWANK